MGEVKELFTDPSPNLYSHDAIEVHGAIRVVYYNDITSEDLLITDSCLHQSRGCATVFVARGSPHAFARAESGGCAPAHTRTFQPSLNDSALLANNNYRHRHQHS